MKEADRKHRAAGDSMTLVGTRTVPVSSRTSGVVEGGEASVSHDLDHPTPLSTINEGERDVDVGWSRSLSLPDFPALIEPLTARESPVWMMAERHRTRTHQTGAC